MYDDLRDLYGKISNLAARYGQSHLLQFCDELPHDELEQLLKAVSEIDFELMERLYKLAVDGESIGSDDSSKVTPIPVAVAADIAPDKREAYAKTGTEIVRSGKYGAITMAGGQGTRLGHKGPKGTFDAKLPGVSSLFEVQCKRLMYYSDKCGYRIPWYIMTSRENDAETRAFFEKNDFFGYGRDNIVFFTQFMLPMLDFDGKIILADKWRIKEGADGHGGIFRAMAASGALDDCIRRGVAWLYTCSIDNVLTQLCDPMFIGFLEDNGYKLGGKSLIKRDPYEKAGVFCLVGGKPSVIEYTEISDEMAQAVDGNGDYLYGDAHILCNAFKTEVFSDMRREGLPYHVAVKKSDYINAQGEKITPDKPNSYKFETFIFDAFSRYDSMGILRVDRWREFAPVKNREGEDSPDTARELYINAVRAEGAV